MLFTKKLNTNHEGKFLRYMDTTVVEGTHHHPTIDSMPQLLLLLPCVLAMILYIAAVIASNKRYKPWPRYRIICWTLGVFFAASSVTGPLAARAHLDFTSHMLGHLFLGMLAPLLFALSAPITLLMRTLNTRLARTLSKLLRSSPIRVLSNPVTAALLNVGGLWVLYTTDLYRLMHEYVLLYVLVHVHLFLAGYLFTVSMIYFDPAPHRTSFLYRSIVFIAALAGHGVLSKFIYAHPPSGVPDHQAELGGMLMYYGGDIIEAAIVFLLCLQWFKATRPKIKPIYRSIH